MIRRWLIVALMAACGSQTTDRNRNPPDPSGAKTEKPLAETNPDHDRVAALIATHAIDELTAPQSAVRREIEQTPGARESLRALGADPQQSSNVRFAAYEVLFAIGGTLEAASDRKSAASTYASALANSERHNLWGMPGMPSRTLRTLLGLGKDVVVPALLPLLDDHRALVYEGSQEPTQSRALGYRVADLAGAAIALLLDISFPTQERDPVKRDAALASLRSAAMAAPHAP
jgi:hypothetical protein